jgi:precorrin-2 dehydrogenase/sirohydrochlorin ferrochelatase
MEVTGVIYLYPIILNLKDRLVSVIGGGEVALRKVNTLLEAGANVQVVSPEFADGFSILANRITIINACYEERFIKGSYLVIAATSSKEVNKSIAEFCRNKRILCNIVDDIELSDIIVPSSIKRGSLIISVSTLGKSPALASKIRKELEEKYTEEYEEYVELLGSIRRLLLERCSDIRERKRILREAIDLSIDELRYIYETLLNNYK